MKERSCTCAIMTNCVSDNNQLTDEKTKPGNKTKNVVLAQYPTKDIYVRINNLEEYQKANE